MFKIILICISFSLIQTKSLPTPAVFDWRSVSAILAVTNLQGCQHASIINVLDAISASYFISDTSAYPTLTKLSEQELLDCVSSSWCKCDTDTQNVTDIIEKIMDSNLAHKLESATTYSYTGFCNSKCSASSHFGTASLVGYKANAGKDEQALYTLLQQGPVIVKVQVSQAFQEYAGGIFSEQNCTGSSTQSLLLVGYGTTAEGQDYWIARNTMGTTWGEQGYIRILRDQNVCGIASNWVQVYAGKSS